MVNKIKKLNVFLNLPAAIIFGTISSQKERILKAAKMTIGSASSKVVSFNQHPVIDKTEKLYLSGLMVGGESMVSHCLILKKKSVRLFNK